ncbi:MAG: ISKra4 family transposase [Agitococcus sp.]
MKIRIQIAMEGNNGEFERIENIVDLERSLLQPETLGLTLAESKTVLQGIQECMVSEQVKEYMAQFNTCPDCGARRTKKGQHTLVYRTVFGKLNLISPRLYDCTCHQPHQHRHSSSPLATWLKAHSSPELLYLETKFASLMSYGLSIRLLSEVLPIADEINATSMRRHQQQITERIESELGEEQFQFIKGCPDEWGRQPRPEPPLTVGLDGGYVHASAQKSRTEGWFEVITGKSVKADGDAKVFAFVNKYDTKPKRRLYEVLKSQGLQMNQQVVFLSDGGDTVRSLQRYLSPESEHLLDWFHITMRLTVMTQMAKGMITELASQKKTKKEAHEIAGIDVPARLLTQLEKIKWHLWHGNVMEAFEQTCRLDDELEIWEENPTNKKKLLKLVREFETYIHANGGFIPNYGDRYRHNETISTAFVESTVNYVISKRFVKKQQMRWTQRGAHLLLQTRVQVLNDDLRKTFCRWFQGMMVESEQEKMAG